MDKETVPIDNLIKQEEQSAKDFFEMGRKVHIEIIGMGGRLVHRTMDEIIYEIPEGSTLEDIKRILGYDRPSDSHSAVEELKE